MCSSDLILDNLKVLESADFTEEELKRIDQASKMENKNKIKNISDDKIKNTANL